MRWTSCPRAPVAAVLAALLFSTTGPGDDAPPVRREVRAVAFSPDGKRLAASTGMPKEPGAVTVWDLASRTALWTDREPTGVPDLTFAPDGRTLAIAAYDRGAKLLDVASGREQAVLSHPKEVRAVAFAPDGRRLATACWDKKLRVWDLASGTVIATCTGHRERIYAVQFSPDGKRLLSAGGGDGARLWDAATGAAQQTWSHGTSLVACARFTPDGRWVLSGGWDGTVRLWDVQTGALRARFGGTGGVDGLAFSPQAEALAVSTDAKVVHLFSLSLREPMAEERARIEGLLARLDDDSYEAREAAGKELLQIGFVAEPRLRQAAAESPSAEVRIRTRRLREALLTQPRALLRGHTAPVSCLAFAPDGKLLASGGKDGTVRLWDVTAGKEMARLSPE
jgi:WD40 repeat protein